MTAAFNIDASKHDLKDRILQNVPDVNLDMCLTCGACTGGCPATGIMDMDPRKVLRMLVLGLEDELRDHPWIWICTMCARCSFVCPMKINFPKIIYNLRQSWPMDNRPKGIRGSCELHVKAGNAMGVPKDDFIWTVEDVAEEIREEQPEFKDLQVTVDRVGAFMAVNQNSREPVTEPEELAPMWKILHMVGADWTYPSVMWAGENYCMFLGDDDGWRIILEKFVDHIDNTLGCQQVVNTE